MRAVLEANVLISALLSPRGTPARLLLAWQAGESELVVSAQLLAEAKRAFAYPKLQRLVSSIDADTYVAWLGRSALVAADPPWPPPVHSEDPDVDYLIVLAAAERAVIVSGDVHLTSLAPGVPVRTPAEFLVELGAL